MNGFAWNIIICAVIKGIQVGCVQPIWVAHNPFLCTALGIDELYICVLWTTTNHLEAYLIVLSRKEDLKVSSVAIADVAVTKRHQRWDDIRIIFTGISFKSCFQIYCYAIIAMQYIRPRHLRGFRHYRNIP